MISERDLMPARLARMNALAEDLERARSEGATHWETLKRLHTELDAARRTLEPCK